MNNSASGIYMIYNTTKHKVYIGQTNNISQRIATHKNQLKLNKHSNKELQDDFNNNDILTYGVLKTTNQNDNGLLLEKEYIYTFREKGIYTYNQESDETVINIIKYELINPHITKIREEFVLNFGCELSQFKRCNPQKIINKCEKTILE